MGMVPIWVHVFPTIPELWDECLECQGCLLLSEEWAEKRFHDAQWVVRDLEREFTQHIDEDHRDDIDDLIDQVIMAFKAMKDNPEEEGDSDDE